MPVLPSTLPPEDKPWVPMKAQLVKLRFKPAKGKNDVPEDLDLFTDFLGHTGIVTGTYRAVGKKNELYLFVAYDLPGRKADEPMRVVHIRADRFEQVLPTPATEGLLQKLLNVFESTNKQTDPATSNAVPA